jgi:hypothetical protein
VARDSERTFYREVKWTPEAVRRFWTLRFFPGLDARTAPHLIAVAERPR